MKLKSSNPLLKNDRFTKSGTATAYDADGRPLEIIDFNNTMTVQGAINKSILLLVLLVASAVFTVGIVYTGTVGVYPLAIGGIIAALILMLIGGRKPEYLPYIAPGFAIFEGVFVGAISAIFELMYPGIVLQAVAGTFVTALVCFLLYRFKIVKVTEQFKSVVVAATLAIGTYYLISIGLSLFTGIRLFDHDNSLISIGFSVFVIVIAALNLFLDFDLMEEGAKRRLPKNMEWYGAMGLIATLVWLYIEFLRLLSKLQD